MKNKYIDEVGNEADYNIRSLVQSANAGGKISEEMLKTTTQSNSHESLVKNIYRGKKIS